MDYKINGFDAIICNPPFNFAGGIKTPTNNTIAKKNDGFAVWSYFINHSISLLRDGGYLCIIVPSLWLKPDRFGTYHFLLNFKIEKIMFLQIQKQIKYLKDKHKHLQHYFY